MCVSVLYVFAWNTLKTIYNESERHTSLLAERARVMVADTSYLYTKAVADCTHTQRYLTGGRFRRGESERMHHYISAAKTGDAILLVPPDSGRILSSVDMSLCSSRTP